MGGDGSGLTGPWVASMPWTTQVSCDRVVQLKFTCCQPTVHNKLNFKKSRSGHIKKKIDTFTSVKTRKMKF